MTSRWPATVQYDEVEHMDARIYGHTNPWLRDKDGVDVNLLELVREGDVLRTHDGACYACTPAIVSGVLEAMDSPEGIQRCDNCELYDSDLAAAAALGQHLDQVLPQRAPFTVWFEREMTDGT